MDLIQIEAKSFFQVYKRLPIIIDRAEGSNIYDINGKRYLDLLGGIAVNALGHSHPEIISTIETQAKKYLHVSNYFYQAPQIELANKLSEISNGRQVFFSNSGAEAIEGAIKLCRKFGNKNNKSELIAFTGGFHGRTYGALSIMDKPNYKNGMEPFLPNTKVIKYNDILELENTVNDKTCAVFLEFIQGEGGLATAKSEFVDKLVELKNKFGFLIVADEIQAGCGRSGKFFAFEHWNIEPDIITLAKGIGGGLPLGAILARKELAELFGKAEHGTTFGGNALSCACGLKVIEILERNVYQNVKEAGDYFKNRVDELIQKFPKLVIENRGIGLMRGIVISFSAKLAIDLLLEKGIVANAASENVIRLVPPLIITKNEIDQFIASFTQLLSDERVYA